MTQLTVKSLCKYATCTVLNGAAAAGIGAAVAVCVPPLAVPVATAALFCASAGVIEDLANFIFKTCLNFKDNEYGKETIALVISHGIGIGAGCAIVGAAGMSLSLGAGLILSVTCVLAFVVAQIAFGVFALIAAAIFSLIATASLLLILPVRVVLKI